MRWFKHESVANMDAKLQSVILEYGMEGYGLYWYCLELIASTVTAENINFELEHDSRIIARNTGLGAQKVQEIMEHFVRLGLFEESQGRITCLKLARRADDYTAKLARGNASQVVENKKLRETPRNSEKVRESPPRTEENRTEKKGRFTPPTVTEVREYCKQRNNGVDPQRFIDFYESKGWYIGKNKMKDWKAAVRTWEQPKEKDNRDNLLAGAK